MIRVRNWKAIFASKGKIELLDLVHSITPHGVNFIYIRQPEPLGLGHAVLCAQPVVGDEPFGVILADDLIYAQRPALGQLIQARASMGGGNVLAVQNVERSETKKYGIVGVDDETVPTSCVRSMVEKPAPEAAPSNMAVIGRYVLEPEIFDTLRSVQRGVGGRFNSRMRSRRICQRARRMHIDLKGAVLIVGANKASCLLLRTMRVSQVMTSRKVSSQ